VDFTHSCIYSTFIFDSLVEKANNNFLKNCEIAATSGAKVVFGIETVVSLPNLDKPKPNKVIM